MSTFEAPSAARIPSSKLDDPKVLVSFVIATAIIAGVIGAILATPYTAARDRQVPGVTEACASTECVSPRQLIAAADARSLKRRFGAHALVVDIAPETAGTAFGSDVKAPFVESRGPTGMTFHVDFANRVDDALRAAGMGHDEPVILLSGSVEHSVLAALLLQERGYTAVLVVRD
jgi:hypothetical protein